MLRELQENPDKQLNDIRKKYKNNMRSSTKRKKWKKNRKFGAEEYNNWRSQYRTAEFSKQKRESLSKKRDQVKLSNQRIRKKNGKGWSKPGGLWDTIKNNVYTIRVLEESQKGVESLFKE